MAIEYCNGREAIMFTGSLEVYWQQASDLVSQGYADDLPEQEMKMLSLREVEARWLRQKLFNRLLWTIYTEALDAGMDGIIADMKFLGLVQPVRSLREW